MILFLLAVLIAYQGVDISNFYVSLKLIGFGWSFSFIGSTSLLTKSHYPSEKGKVQEINDFFLFCCSIICNLGLANELQR